jgi:hypothetical protein
MKIKMTKTSANRESYSLKLDASWRKISKKEATQRIENMTLVIDTENAKLWLA